METTPAEKTDGVPSAAEQVSVWTVALEPALAFLSECGTISVELSGYDPSERAHSTTPDENDDAGASLGGSGGRSNPYQQDEV